MILKKFLRHLSAFNLPKNSKILLACSAGSDSVAMVSLFAYTQNEHGFSLHIGHINHHLRCENETQKDEQTILKLADFYQIPYDIRHIDPHIFQESTSGTEALARHVRYEKLHEIAREHGCEFLALAHNEDDMVETVYMRLVQQYGIAGLAGIPTMRNQIFRPLLGFSKIELIDFLQTYSIDWHEDISNDEAVFFRNRVRQDLKKIFEFAPSLKSGLLHLAKESQQWKQHSDHLMHYLYDEEIYEEGRIVFPVRIFSEQDPLTQQRLIYRWFNYMMKGVTLPDFRLPRRFVQTLQFDHGRVVLRGYGILLVKEKGMLIFSKE
ncbi:MAG: tRNA lysidine(34) synthetase TilS [Spirochaetia bacterium]